jgi:16S rRNA (adenine1518-N6/adenine1519-N6)-dimethyltransferase
MRMPPAAQVPSAAMTVLTPGDVRQLLETHSLSPSRALGQHFLADPNTARRISRLAEVDVGDRVLEIGPGLGSLTLALADTGATVKALELDRHLLPALTEVAGGRSNVTIEHGDALTFDFATSLEGSGWVCVSNLPYNVAAPVVLRMLEEVPQVTRMLVMVQREVGERLAASPGSDAYGAVSVKVAYHAEARVVGSVPATVFVPRPRVESVLVRLDRRPSPPVAVPSTDLLFELVRAGFATRRKMLRRSLRSVLGARTEDVLAAAGVTASARAESLGLDEWAALARAGGERSGRSSPEEAPPAAPTNEGGMP